MNLCEDVCWCPCDLQIMAPFHNLSSSNETADTNTSTNGTANMECPLIKMQLSMEGYPLCPKQKWCACSCKSLIDVHHLGNATNGTNATGAINGTGSNATLSNGTHSAHNKNRK